MFLISSGKIINNFSICIFKIWNCPIHHLQLKYGTNTTTAIHEHNKNILFTRDCSKWNFCGLRKLFNNTLVCRYISVKQNIVFMYCWQNDSMEIPVGTICYEDTSVEKAASPASSALPKLNPTRVGIILVGSIVMDTLTNLPQEMCILFGFTYALHLQYPKCLKNTIIFIHQVLLNLGRSELPPKVQKLKTLRSKAQFNIAQCYNSWFSTLFLLHVLMAL